MRLDQVLNSRFCSGYYVLHVLTFLAFGLLRLKIRPEELAAMDPLGFKREGTVWLSLCLMIVARSFSQPSLDAFLAHAFKFTKVAMMIVLYYMSPTLALVFTIVWAGIFVVCPQPRAKDPKVIQVLNRGNFDGRITKNDAQTIWIVHYHATWSPLCTQLAPVYAEIAKEFDHPRLRFGKVDVSLWPDLAVAANVNVSGTSRQIPTYIAYKQGKEVARFPSLSVDESIVVDDVSKTNKSLLIDTLHIVDLHRQAEDWEETARKKYENLRAKNKHN